MANKRIKVTKDGPYKVSGSVPIQKQIIIGDGNGISEEWKAGEKYPDKDECGLCRCEKSSNKPYRDGSLGS